jgi:pilus assembly protein Flp/PilA
LLTARQYLVPVFGRVSHVQSFRVPKDESGATAIEYGLIAAGISIVIIASVNSIGSTLNGTFAGISTQLK